MRIGLMTDFPSQSVQSGPAIHTRFLYERMMGRGHDLVLMGPDTSDEAPLEGETHLYRPVAYPTHPKVKIAMPTSVSHLWDAPRVDVVHSQSNTYMIHYAAWMRKMWGIPMVSTHTVHIPTHSHFVLSDELYQMAPVRNAIRRQAASVESNYASMFNMGDCLVVQSRHFVDYWQQRGVTVPIEVIGRPIDPSKFSRRTGRDPFPRHFEEGKRLLCVCRHDREKSLDHLIRIFDEHIAPADPDVTLTLVGDGHDHVNLMTQADTCRARRRIHFTGELQHGALVDWYDHADTFLYTSVSETFGNVVNEALWCGMPVVALDDRMGVSHQVHDQVNGYLITPNASNTDERFAARALELCWNPSLRRRLSERAAEVCQEISHPDVVARRFEKLYREAQVHCRREVRKPLVESNRALQMRSFAYHVGTWSLMNGMLLGLAQVATRVGASRTGGAVQHMNYVRKPIAEETTIRVAG